MSATHFYKHIPYLLGARSRPAEGDGLTLPLAEPLGFDGLQALPSESPRSHRAAHCRSPLHEVFGEFKGCSDSLPVRLSEKNLSGLSPGDPDSHHRNTLYLSV